MAAPTNPAPTILAPRRRVKLWKWLFGSASLLLVLLLTALGIGLWPQWQAWRLVGYIRAHGGEVEFSERSVAGGIGPTQRNVIVSIALSDDAVRRIDLSRLAALEHLETVTIERSNVEAEHLQAFTRLANLSIFSFSDSSLYGDCGGVLARIPQLAGLTLVNCALEDETTLAALAGAPLLQRVSLYGSQITNRQASCLAQCTSLTAVQIHGPQVTDETVRTLATLPNLRSLDLKTCQITDAALVSLQRCQLLKELSVSETAVTGTGLATLTSLPELSSLDLDNTRLTNDAALRLGDFAQLEYLSLVNAPLDDTVAPALLRLKNLLSLQLQGTAITDAAAAELANLPKLYFLGLEETKVTAAGIDKLRVDHAQLNIHASPIPPDPAIAPAFPGP